MDRWNKMTTAERHRWLLAATGNTQTANNWDDADWNEMPKLLQDRLMRHAI